MACITCPFAYTDESEQIQNYGCLPTPHDIIQMKRESGHNWSCHANDQIVCQGLKEEVTQAQEKGWRDDLSDIDMSVGEIISYEVWNSEGQHVAIAKAGQHVRKRGKTGMDISRVKKQWEDYNEEFDESDYMDIETHTSMAMQVGPLLDEIERMGKILVDFDVPLHPCEDCGREEQNPGLSVCGGCYHKRITGEH